jgi:signal peptidase complex subunit 2
LTADSYFILIGVLTVYTTYKERGIFLVALEKDRAGMDPDNTWTLCSCLRK